MVLVNGRESEAGGKPVRKDDEDWCKDNHRERKGRSRGSLPCPC
jgi:hypothetical protein